MASCPKCGRTRIRNVKGTRACKKCGPLPLQPIASQEGSN
jgi:ribosomal protein L37AE/L43A